MKTVFLRSAVLLGLGLSLGLTACDKQLDIDPYQSVDAATALDSEDKVGSAVVGIYARLDDPNLYGTNLILVPEILAPDSYIRFQGTFSNFRDIANRNTNSQNTTAEGIWRTAYQAINQANLVIDALPVVTTANLKTQYEGEARFVRADMYFELVRLYARQYEPGGANTQPGVPINLVPVKNLEEAALQLPRATVAAVYQQVIDDLTKAITLLPADNGTRASSFTAKALLARVYLQQSNFAQAQILANDVIQNSGKLLSSTVQSVFRNRNSAETLLEIQQNDQNNAGTSNSGLATHFASIGQLGRGDVQVLGSFAAQYGRTDARGTDSLTFDRTRKLIYIGDGARPGVLRSGKFSSYGQNIPVIRLAEMYLIRAEASQQLGTNIGGVTPWEDVNRIRLRSQADTLNPKKLRDSNGNITKVDNPLFGTITLADILQERRLELAFEGFRIYDLKRTGGTLAAGVPSTAPKLTLPIPQREININPSLVQNEGYQ
ncbi:RagB/SusD family nutrient uptake outer membrane protein [Hymenobacter sp. 5516J-16]|uniref:RagB/SusD family nutrient uptake outer membrane protein n=1 Tax=Hymenobacter sp. 5516J-16 TaxID=2932253 RepID=UPI001FD480FE|nr:RagB/SusD family nutrient uptake outer membrane protein [Hymenobacter sp. 5516J-16]UOQ78136.1 RagB/SusD family nutrient uptake outer membrane protein [Hymenobacter sp. 5516J-16]